MEDQGNCRSEKETSHNLSPAVAEDILEFDLIDRIIKLRMEIFLNILD